jgi:hypothetical protein
MAQAASALCVDGFRQRKVDDPVLNKLLNKTFQVRGTNYQSSVYTSQKLSLLRRKVAVPTGLDFPLPCKGWHFAQGSHRTLHFMADRRVLPSGGVCDLVVAGRGGYPFS